MSIAMPIDPENDPRNWSEDFEHENGKYYCRCCKCEELFIGYKRRVICKICFNQKTWMQEMFGEKYFGLYLLVLFIVSLIYCFS